MTLKEKFIDAFKSGKRFDIQNAETITDEFAIDFAEWCDDNYFRMGNTSFWAESMDWDNDNKFTTKKLLELYKKTL